MYPSTGSGCIKFLVPFGEVAEAGAEGDGGLETEVTFEGGGVGIGDRNVTGSFDKLRMYCIGHHVLMRRSAEPVEAVALLGFR